MISLVTQSDGSARRFPFVAYALAIAMGLTFSSLREQTGKAQSQADAAMSNAIGYFEEHPALTLPDRMSRYVSAGRVDELREAEAEARSASGLRQTLKSRQRRMQTKLDELVALAFDKQEDLPFNSFAVTSTQDPPVRFFDHVLHHASLEALLLSLFAVLLFGIALEDAWGSVVFGTFCAAMVPAAAVLYISFPPALAEPWVGGAGLSVALLGASAARWFKSGSPRLLGGLPMAPWLWIPAWFAVDAILVRQLTERTLELAPTALYGSLLASGFVLAMAFRRFGFEELLTDRWDDSKTPVRNPAYEKAMELRAEGKRDEAMELLSTSFARKASVDFALGMWDVSKELGRPEDGAAGAIHLIRDALRRKDLEAATKYWCELAEMIEVVDAEPPLFLKIGELLAAEGKQTEAVAAIDFSTRAPRPLPPALALRAATFVAERDASVASRVASRAIDGGTCTAREKTALTPFVVNAPAGSKPREVAGFRGLVSKAPEPMPVSEPAAAVAAPTAVDAQDAFENLDPGALDPNALGADAGSEAAGLDGPGADSSEVEGWNSPGMLADLGESRPEEEFGAVDPAVLDTETTRAELFGGVDDDEPLAGSIEDQMAAEAAVAASAASHLSAPASADGVEAEPDPDESTDPFCVDQSSTRPIFDDPVGEDRATAIEYRTVRVIEAVPLALEDAAIKVDADGKGKTRLPFERIDAIAVGAVRGLGERPVVLVDLVLNLRGDPSEPLRVLRIRSDRFDPRSLVAGEASGVQALQAFVATIATGSRADRLPNEESVRGEPFAMFESLVEYHREVLHVDREVA